MVKLAPCFIENLYYLIHFSFCTLSKYHSLANMILFANYRALYHRHSLLRTGIPQ